MTESLVDKLEDPIQVKRIAAYLHSTIKLREAVQVNKRVNYFRGKKLYEVLCTPISSTDKKDRPFCSNEEEARQVGIALLKHELIHASMVANKERRELRPVQTNTFEGDGYYTWMYQGSTGMRYLMIGTLITAIAAMCLFPIWPQSAKVGIWYVSVTLLLFLFVLFSVRLVLYIIFWCVGFEFWILPNFFDEDLGVADSFRPLVSFERGNDLAESWLFRGAGVVGLISFAYWCSQQPTDFDELYASQVEFLLELYDGSLMKDPAKEEAIRETAIPDVASLKKAIEREEAGLDPEEENVDDDEGVDMDKMMEEDDAAEAEDAGEEEEVDI